jgi:hypothetical protein
VEKVENFKFLGIHITENLKLSTHTDSVAKKARQLLFNLRKPVSLNGDPCLELIYFIVQGLNAIE